MSELDRLLHRIYEAELELGRSLPYGPYSSQVEEAWEELRELRAAPPDPPDAELWRRKQGVGDALVAGLEELEANPDDQKLWTALADKASQWRSLRSFSPDAQPSHEDDDPAP